MGIIGSGVRMSAGELGCTYAALLLNDDGQDVSEDKLKALLNASGISFEAYWPGLFCRAFNDYEGGIEKLITTPALGGGGGGGGAGPAADAGNAGGDDKAAKKKSSSDEDELAAPAVSIFGDDGGDDY